MFKIEKGVYSNRRNVTELSTFLVKHPNVIFTLESAFFYHGMTSKRPDKYVVVTKKPAWRIVDPQIKQYFMDAAIYDIGVTKIQVNNTWIPIYDKERMLIELVRYRKKLDPEYYQEIKNVTGNSMYVVRDDSGLKLIDSNLNTVLANGFEDIVSINGENLIIKNGDLYGVIKTSGESKVPVEYEDLSYATDNYYVAKKGGLYGIISIENVVCVDFKYNSLEYLHSTDFYQAENSDFTTDIIDRNFETKLSHIIISELNIEGNYMQVRENGEYKYYNLNIVEETNINALKTNTLFLSKNGDKYGYVNKDGELIVDYKYDDAREQNSYGYCAVKQNGLWGVLDSSGNVILEPSVNLDDNLYIEFISTWHLYDDLSLNIYVK